MDNSKEYILCAAIEMKEVKYTVLDAYSFISGYRHCDILSQFGREVITSPDAQGFMTSKGRFVNRHEAAQIAFECGQISKNMNILSSEDLY
jgi:hypothetical protein